MELQRPALGKASFAGAYPGRCRESVEPAGFRVTLATNDDTLKIETILSPLLRRLWLSACIIGLVPSVGARPVEFRLEFVGSDLLGYYGDNLGALQRMDTLLKYSGGNAVLDSVVLESGSLRGESGTYLDSSMARGRLAQMREYLQRRAEYYEYPPLPLQERVTTCPPDTDPRDVTAVRIAFYLNENRPRGYAAEVRKETESVLPHGKIVRPASTKPVSNGRRTEQKMPVFAFKTDLVLWGGISPGFDVTTCMPNLSAEVYLGHRWSVELSALYTHCKSFRNEGLLVLDAYRIEPRFWFGNDRLFRGFYAGVSVGYGSFDNRPPSDISEDNTGYTGTFLTTGLTAGYTLALSPHWLLEMGITGDYRMEKSKSYRMEQGCSYFESELSRNRLIPGVKLNLTYRICRHGRAR